MTSNGILFENSTAYILHVKNEFSYSFYYHNFCNGMTRQQVQSKFEKDITDAVFDFRSIDPLIHEYRTEQIQNGFPILQTQEVEAFWLLLKEKQNYYLELSRKNDYMEELHKAYTSNRSSAMSASTSTSTSASALVLPSLSSAANVFESDSLVFFNERSLSSILKSHGKELLARYESLLAEDQARCGLCLNGILDLTNQTSNGQRQLFSPQQWQYLNKHFASKQMKHLIKLGSQTDEKIRLIQKTIRDGNAEEAYYLSLEHIRHAHPKDKCIFKIISHIINVYTERSNIFTDSLSKTSEMDFVLKLWGEVLELLFGDSNVLNIKWEETIPATTATAKHSNNNSKSHTIGCEVDDRVVCQVSKLVDTCHIKTAKASADYTKIITDKFKLAAETKCIIDDMVMSNQLKGNKYVKIHNLQIFGLQAEVCSLKLIDHGLYVNTLDFDLSLDNDLETFSKNLVMWVRRLLQLKKDCLGIASLSKKAFNKKQKTFEEMFNREGSTDKAYKYCSPSWVTGTFMPPTRQALTSPKSILTCQVSPSISRSMANKAKEIILEDGTRVRSRLNADKKRKRVSAEVVTESNKKHCK